MHDRYDRYEVLGPLGSGSSGRTLKARDTATEELVAIKELAIASIGDWKQVELFEREGRALANLNHPAIPRYLDAFHLEDEGGLRYFLVQELVDGESLDQPLARGERFDDADAWDFLTQLLDVLEYLHGLSPPVVHRDIKPSNIIRRPDGRFALIDFGAVQALNPDTMGGSTIVGTSGYMPPEQLLGRAAPASDLYALGATAVHLLSGVPPHELPMERMKLRFEGVVTASREVVAALDGMLEPAIERRVRTAAEVRALLHAGATSAESATPASGAATQVPAPMRDLLAARPPSPQATVSLQGDRLELNLTTMVFGRATSGCAVAGFGTIVSALVATCSGIASESGVTVVVVLVLGLVATGVLTGLGGRSSQTAETLRVDGAGVTLEHYRVHRKTGELCHPVRRTLPLHEVAGVWARVPPEGVVELAWHRHLVRAEVAMKWNYGLVIPSHRGGEMRFGNALAVAGTTSATTELIWLTALVSRHLEGLSETSEETST